MTQQDIEAMKDVSISRGAIHSGIEQIDYTYAIEHEGEVLAIGGIRLLTPTTAMCWTDLSCHSKRYMLRIYRAISEWLETLTKDYGIKRLQTYIEMDPVMINWIEHLNFKRESVMKQFLDGKDVYLYARLT
jgi:hypothetical protein